MATSLLRDAEIAAGLAPFDTMGRNPAPAKAVLREQVSKLVP
jgi:hypothetical protein